jgi:hypothetical protein
MLMIAPKHCLEATSGIAAFISIMTLYYGSLGISHEDKSWGGKTPRELAINRRQKVMAWIGIPCAVLALISQLIVIFYF